MLSKITNYMTAVDELEIDVCSAPAGIQYPDGRAGFRSFVDLRLERWHTDLPPRFSSAVRMPLEGSGENVTSPRSSPSFDGITCTIPTCGCTMQDYYMACIFLLMRKLLQRRALRATFTERLALYRRIYKEVVRHS